MTSVDLSLAVERGDLDRIDALTAQGVSVNEQNQINGFYIALHNAARHDSVPMAEAIMNCGNFNNYLTISTPRRNSVFHTCALNHSLAVAKAYYRRCPEYINLQNVFGETPLRIAVDESFVKFMEWCLEIQTDPDTVDIRGDTPLMSSLDYPRDPDNPDDPKIFEIMLRFEPDVNAPPDTNSIRSALHVAIRNDRFSDVRKLLELNAMVEFSVTFDWPLSVGGSSSYTVASENMSTIALKEIDLGSLNVAGIILYASVSPPDPEAIFYVFAQFFHTSGKGLSITDSQLMEMGRNDHLNIDVKQKLIRILAMALAHCHGPLKNPTKLERRFNLPPHIFDELCYMYSMTESLSHRSALEMRRLKIQEGAHNNMIHFDQTNTMHTPISMHLYLDYIYDIYTERLSKLIV